MEVCPSVKDSKSEENGHRRRSSLVSSNRIRQRDPLRSERKFESISLKIGRLDRETEVSVGQNVSVRGLGYSVLS